MSAPFVVELAWPPRALSPNGRVHPMQKYRFQKAAKNTAYWQMRAAMGRDHFAHGGGDIVVTITAHPIAGKVRPDDDNLIGSLKHSLDGVALALGVDDKHFRPSLEWGEPVPSGRVVIAVAA